jgi:hypothetical protein
VELELNLEDEEEKHGSKVRAFFRRFFRSFNPKQIAEQDFFMRKLFSRYKLAIKMTLSASVFLSIFNEASYWLDAYKATTFVEGFFKVVYILVVGLVYLMLVTNKSQHEHQYFRSLIALIIFGGSAIKVLELEYLIYLKQYPDEEM